MRILKKNLGFCLTMMCMVMTTLWSCSDSDENTTDGTGDGTTDGGSKIEVQDPAPDKIGTTSAEFKLIAEGAESYVVEVVEGANATQPDPVLVYKKAEDNGTVKQITENAITETISGLEGNKTYSIFFVFKTKEGYEVIAKQLTTAKYTQKVTILEAGMFHIKLHVEVPEDVYYSIGCQRYEDYMTYKINYGRPDISCVTYGGGLPSPRYKGPQTITLKDGEFTYKGAVNEAEVKELGVTEEDFSHYIKPGTAYAIFMGQCEADGNTDAFVEGQPEGGIDPGPLNASMVPSIKEYAEEIEPNGDMRFTGHCAKTVLFTQQANPGNGKVDVRFDRITEKTAIVTFTPSEEVLKYAVMTIDNTVLQDMILPLCGGEEGMQAMVLNYGDAVEGEQQATIPLEAGKTYSIYVTAVYNEEATLQTFHKVTDLKPIVSDKPASELEIKPLNLNDPYKVGYNIRAINGDCLGFKFLMNYTDEWYPMINSMNEGTQEANIAAMMAQYAASVNDAETMALVNSAQGFDIMFSSIDDMESWLVVESYNEDEKTKLYWEGANLRVKSAALTPEAKVQTDLYDKLQGTWKATMTRASGNTKPVEMEITIGNAPKKVDRLPADVKENLVKYYMEEIGYNKEKAETMVTQTFNEYKTLQQKYAEKYAGQNYLVGSGFSYDQYYSKFADSWDLFQSTSYSAVSTEEMFRDYGPKLFFKFEEGQDGKVHVYVPTTRIDEKGDYLRYVDPVANWSMMIDLFGYNKNQANSQYMADFPVEISEDCNTITIKPNVEGGVTYTPSFAMQYQAGMSYSWSFQTNEAGIVLERQPEPALSRATAAHAPVMVPELKMHQGNHFRRTRAPYGFIAKEPIQLNVFSTDSLKK